jgi:prostaglandin-H2 D-isomerase / glutathione transferase
VYKLTYFDAPVSRGEECRLAFHVAGVAFDDERIPNAEWATRKPATPFGALPTLSVDGKLLGQSNAILALIGRRHGLHPKDDFEAARHESVMMHVEDLRAQLGPTLRMKDPEQKKVAREALAADYIPAWSTFADRQIGDAGPFFAGNAIHVVDIKLFVVLRWIKNGTVDHVPATIFDGHTKLMRVYDAVRTDPRIVSWATKR